MQEPTDTLICLVTQAFIFWDGALAELVYFRYVQKSPLSCFTDSYEQIYFITFVSITSFYLNLFVVFTPRISSFASFRHTYPDSKVHGTNMGPIWGRQDPGRPHVGPMNFAIWVHAKQANEIVHYFTCPNRNTLWRNIQIYKQRCKVLTCIRMLNTYLVSHSC